LKKEGGCPTTEGHKRHKKEVGQCELEHRPTTARNVKATRSSARAAHAGGLEQNGRAKKEVLFQENKGKNFRTKGQTDRETGNLGEVTNNSRQILKNGTSRKIHGKEAEVFTTDIGNRCEPHHQNKTFYHSLQDTEDQTKDRRKTGRKDHLRKK